MRYWDHPQPLPLFPFGYGLSYTSFSFSNLRVTPASRVGDPIEVSAEVANNGKRAGDAVVQLYITNERQCFQTRSGNSRALTGWRLEAGEKRTIHFKTGKDELKSGARRRRPGSVEPKQFDVWVGEIRTPPCMGSFV